ncbi:2OG-Fe(II) oxygenase superfamily protein [Kitasatospora sp. MMS16-BH015]|uniref:2OG-Fe(II) oxygenase n=1 Tax=Kitasatospora sp. MMS16-BH015 TaxID=2018025 RepID=UPI000CA12EC8|nr:2OG-Fe(II) oxygenase [Kitasatospora sp. MMS16-BH015]AUG78264.1 2OG-Fe(II) oxygenase superfamily protein [Kitasatospora sp. MMS16-BH015]
MPTASPLTTPSVRLARARAVREPFDYYHLDETFEPAQAERLRASFPEAGFTKVSSADPQKTYTMWTRVLHPADESEATELPEPWREFLAEVTGPAYRAQLSELTGIDLAESPVEVNLWRYPHDCWLDPHVDKESKLVTQVFYFNRPWPEEWGGNLLLLGSGAVTDVARRVAPADNTSVVLVRSGNSWHAVEKAGPANPGAARLSAQVIFLRPGGFHPTEPVVAEESHRY